MDKEQVHITRRRNQKKFQIMYSFVDYEQAERQKKLDDAYDVIFDDMEIDDDATPIEIMKITQCILPK